MAKATLFRVLIIVAANQPSPDEELWQAICICVQSMLAAKHKGGTQCRTIEEKVNFVDATAPPSSDHLSHNHSRCQLDVKLPTSAQPPILPPELLPLIFQNLVPTRSSAGTTRAPLTDLLNCAKVNRQWHLAAIPLLYACPRLLTTASLAKFVDLLEREPKRCAGCSVDQLWDYTELVKRVQFGAEVEVDTAQLAQNEARLDGRGQRAILGYCQSSLFRTLLASPNTAEQPFFDPIFLRLLACPNIAKLEEVVSTDGSQQATNGVLHLLLGAIRRVKALSAFIDGGHIALFNIVKYLLDAFHGEERPIWKEHRADAPHNAPQPPTSPLIIPPQTIRKARPFIHTHCKSFLNNLSTSTFLEAQYLAMAAGRVLDTYTGIHFSVLQASMGIDVLVLGPLLRIASRNETSSNTNISPPSSPHRYDPHSLHQATLILTILRLIFHKPFSSSPYPTPPTTPPPPFSSDLYPLTHPLTRLLTNPTFLRDALMNFPPSGLNPETAELLMPHLHELQETLPSPGGRNGGVGVGGGGGGGRVSSRSRKLRRGVWGGGTDGRLTAVRRSLSFSDL
ncbi:hypothetical protein HK097_009238 [Rhizophlyctis rosea]|uniref:F-box domain-containing protein n=1 Tax=Rhizophlyctis rosea TaxID=64517 RepID=A0AAD5SC79_9FUNG|nr:hypothetical protein HK097_009238 [Rhizophlyctis rosea]